MITTTGKPPDMVGDIPDFTYTATAPDGIDDVVTGVTIACIQPDGQLSDSGTATELAPNVWRCVCPPVTMPGTWTFHIETAGLVDVGEIKAVIKKSSVPET